MDKNEFKKRIDVNQTNLIWMEKELKGDDGGGNGDGDYSYVPKYDYEYRESIKRMVTYPEYAIHFMGLPGFVYRNLKTDTKNTIDTVYELVRLSHMSGAKYIRTFMINGSRKASEAYMAKALPWITMPNNKIDFNQRNDYYFQCCKIIEQACKYWWNVHRPTFWMDRYNRDIFHPDNNIQGINDFRSKDALVVKLRFMEDYIFMQKDELKNNSDPTFEWENEPNSRNRKQLGALMADQALEMFRALQAINRGVKIENVWVCSTDSEFQHANFVNKHWFGNPLNRYFGSAEFKSRKIKTEHHGQSTLDSLLGEGFSKALGSGWPQICANEDGANDGEYNPLPWTNYRLADRQELIEMLMYALTACKARRKRFFFTAFAMDCLEQDPNDGIAKETYKRLLDNMELWKRYKAYADVRADLGY